MTARLSGGSYDLGPTSEISLDDDSKIENEILDKEKRRLHIRWGAAFSVAVVIILGLIIGIAVKGKGNDASPSQQNGDQSTTLPTPLSTPLLTPLPTPLPTQVPTTSIPIPKEAIFPQSLGNLSIANLSMSIGNKISWIHDQTTMYDPSRQPLNCSDGTSDDICIGWPGDRQLNVTNKTTPVPIYASGNNNNLTIECWDVQWQALVGMQQVLTDCFNVSTSHWYGGYEDHYQYWPFERNEMNLSAYVANDAYNGRVIGNVLERYFVSSSGIGIYVENDVPLYFSLNPSTKQMCLSAKYDNYPYLNIENKLPYLKYTICNGNDVKLTHLTMSSKYIDKPRDIPNEELFRRPIWSTWAQFHKDVTQEKTLNYTKQIFEHKFPGAQVEIDDVWTPHYGDYTFDDRKFPNASDMIKQIHDLGYNVTVWVHPFFESDSQSFQDASDNGYFLRESDSYGPALTSWWNGNTSGILDVTYPGAVTWFIEKMNSIRNKYGVDSFKFDAGEMTYVPNIYTSYNTASNPCDIYPGQYVKMAAEADSNNRQEVRSAYRTQKYPLVVRQIDKDSNWGHKNAFKTIIPTGLTMGLIGYSFVMTDMVGGNAYNDTPPDAELFIRWTQLSVFFPVIQFSIAPWDFNETIEGYNFIDLVKHYVDLHTNLSDTFIKFARIATQTGEPIIRPLWWIDPLDDTALTCEDEFLIGDKYLVAPVLNQGARFRDIYFPTGTWQALSTPERGRNFLGPMMAYNYSVPLNETAYFINVIYL